MLEQNDTLNDQQSVTHGNLIEKKRKREKITGLKVGLTRKNQQHMHNLYFTPFLATITLTAMKKKKQIQASTAFCTEMKRESGIERMRERHKVRSTRIQTYTSTHTHGKYQEIL